MQQPTAPVFTTLNEKIADSLYSLLVEHLGADETGRPAFIWHYCNAPDEGEAACHDLRCEGRHMGAYTWTRRGLGAVVNHPDMQAQRQANAAIERLERLLLTTPPVVRLDWIHGAPLPALEPSHVA